MCGGGGGGGGNCVNTLSLEACLKKNVLCSEMCNVFMFFVKEANGLKTNKLSCSCSSLSLSQSLSLSLSH